RHLLDAGDSAEFGARFLIIELMLHALAGVLFKRDARVAALLRAIMNQTVFTDVEVTRTSAATPLVGAPVRELILKPIEPRPAFLAELLQLLIDPLLDIGERLELSR